jgi:hypothetical protein
MALDVPAESFIQVIFTAEDLSAITTIRIEEKTLTPGTAYRLGFLETTRLPVFGKYNNQWLDLSDLNIVYSVEKNTGIKTYSGGLVQRTMNSDKQEKVTVKTFDGHHKAEIMIR